MARLISNQTNFTAGEMTPRMMGRGDVARYQNGAETIENGICTVHGGVMRRQGTAFLAPTKTTAAGSRLIRYVFSVDQAYILEFGNKYIRVFDGTTGAIILNDALAVLEITTPYTLAQLKDITTRQRSDVMLLFHPDVPTQQLRRLTPSKWTLVPTPWIAEPFAELGIIPDAKLALSAATVGTGRTFTTSSVVVPGAPTLVAATARNAGARVTFAAPAANGGSKVLDYTVTSSPGGITATGVGSPIVIPGLTNGVSYTFTVKARNKAGEGAASSASNSVTPAAGLPGATITVAASSINRSVKNGTQYVVGLPASASGGVAPYSYRWTKLSGSSSITIADSNGPSLGVDSTAYGSTNYMAARVTATDATGTTGSVDINVSVRHVTGSGGEVPL